MSAVALRPAATRSPLWIVVWAVPIAVGLLPFGPTSSGLRWIPTTVTG